MSERGSWISMDDAYAAWDESGRHSRPRGCADRVAAAGFFLVGAVGLAVMMYSAVRLAILWLTAP